MILQGQNPGRPLKKGRSRGQVFRSIQLTDALDTAHRYGHSSDLKSAKFTHEDRRKARTLASKIQAAQSVARYAYISFCEVRAPPPTSALGSWLRPHFHETNLMLMVGCINTIGNGPTTMCS